MSKLNILRFVAALLAAVASNLAAGWIQPVLAFDLPPGGSLVPPGEWWKQPPFGLTDYDGFGQVEGVYGCVFWQQLPPGKPINNTICGYLDLFPVPEPTDSRVRPKPDDVWACVKYTNILPYSVPFNRGACMYYRIGGVPENSFTPSQEDSDAYYADLDTLVNDALGMTNVVGAPQGAERTTQEFRKTANRASSALGIGGAIYGIAKAVTCPLTQGVGCERAFTDFFARLLATSYPLGALTPYSELTPELRAQSDSADADFRAIALPTLISAQPLTVTEGITPEEVKALNASMANFQQQISLLRAILVALDRADAAAQANEPFWEFRQMQAASDYGEQLASLLDAQPLLLADLKAAFTASGKQFTFSRADAVAYQDRIRLEGFSEEEKVSLAGLGATEDEIDAMRRFIVVADEGAIVGLADQNSGVAKGYFPEFLTVSDLTVPLQDLASSLREGPLEGFTPQSSLYIPMISESD